jgi:class 3 adenylate cyclase/tetratricopeptide (TPR) repeat protein
MECPSCSHDNPPENRFCGGCGYALSPSAGIEADAATFPAVGQLKGERRQATVLFSDLAGYTAMNENLDPEEVRGIMGRVFSEAARIIAKYEGAVEKYIGDAVMAVFGVPHAHEGDPVRAIRAARELQQFVEALSPELADKIGCSLSMHTGINTGLVVTGPAQGEGALGVVGDTVNVASRLSDLAGAGEILVGAETQTLVERYFTLVEMPPAEVKGKAEPILAFKLLAPRERPAATHRFAGLRAELIGRGVETALLERAVEGLRDGKGSIISVRGEAGWGKSRLIEEFRIGLPEGKYTWLAGNAHEHTRAIPYYPLMDLLNHAWYIEEGDPPRRVREKIESAIQGLLEGPESAIPYVGGLYALDYPELVGISPEYWVQRLYAASLDIFEAMAGQAPTVFFLEDLHWADPSVLKLLRHLLTRFRQPAVTLCTYRPPFHLFPPEEAGGVPGYQEIELAPLSPSQTDDLCQGLLQGGSVPPDLIGFVQKKAEGNPFFVEEVLTSLIESKALMRENGSWRLASSLSDFHVPSTVQGVIAARLDRLERENRRLLQEASVIGRTFLHKVLGKTTEVSEDFDRRLHDLEQTDLIRTLAREPDLEYMFKHPLTQEVVYDSLLKAEREVIHERVANVMEELLADRLPEFYETLAFHYKQGRSLHKAVDYLMKSGEKAVNRFALEESHNYYAEAYRLLKTRTDKSEGETNLLFDLLNQWGIVFYYFGTVRDMVDLLRRHEAQAETVQDKVRQGMFFAFLGMGLFFLQRMRDAERYLTLALTLGEEADNPKVIGYACTWLTMTCAHLSRYKEALAHGERANEIAQTMPEDHYLYFKSLGMIGYTNYFLGEAVKTREVGHRLVEHGQRHGNPRSIFFGHWMISWGDTNAGKLALAMSSSAKGIGVTKDPMYLLWARGVHGINCLLNGSVAPELELAVNQSCRVGAELTTNLWGGLLGLGRIIQGRMAEGMKMIEEGSRKSLENGDLWTHHLLEYVKGKVYLQMAIGDPPPPVVMVKNLGFLVRHRPFAARRAETLIGQTAAFHWEKGSRGHLAQGLLDLASLHKAKRRKAKVIACLEEAEVLFEQVGADAFQQQIRELLAELR